MPNDLLCSASAVIMISALSLITCIFAILSEMWSAALKGQKVKGPVKAMIPILTNAKENFHSNRAKYSIHSVIQC